MRFLLKKVTNLLKKIPNGIFFLLFGNFTYLVENPITAWVCKRFFRDVLLKKNITTESVTFGLAVNYQQLEKWLGL